MTTAIEPMASIPEVAISVIHDFRNALATIRASSEILIRSGTFQMGLRSLWISIVSIGCSLICWEAVEVMPDGGTIYIGATAEPHTVLIQIRDTGPGPSHMRPTSHADAPYSKTRRTGGTVKKDCLNDSPGSKESAIFKMKPLARARCSPALR
jgi:hypothetical protein